MAFFLNSQVVDLEIFSYIGNWLSKLECIILKHCCNFFRQISFKRWTVMALWTTGQTGKLMEIIIYLSYNNFCSFWERGHLHDGVILLLWPGSFRVLLSCANLGVCYLNLTGITNLNLKRKTKRFLVVVVKWRHCANGLLIYFVVTYRNCSSKLNQV